MSKYFDYNNATVWEKLKISLKSWRSIGVGKSLLLWFLIISIIPLGAVSFINFLNAYNGLTVVAQKSLNTTSQLRVEHIKSFFSEITEFLDINSKQNSDIEFVRNISEEWRKSKQTFNEFKNTKFYQDQTRLHYDEYKGVLQNIGYCDVVFIDKDANVIYRLKECNDLGTNLFSGPFQNTLFAKAVWKAKETLKPQFSDLEYYQASINFISGHFVQPILDESNEILGYVALQINMDRINQMIEQDGGYGETGEAFIVGKDHLLRSITRFGTENDILTKRVDNEKFRDWQLYLQSTKGSQQGSTNAGYEKVSNYDADESGKYVLGIFRDLGFLEPYGVQWVLIEEIEHSEAFAYARRLSDIVKISFFITIIMVFLTSILVTRWFVNPIKQLSAWAKGVAEGKLETKSIKAPNNEVGEMVVTFNRLVRSLQSYAIVAKMMAKGDYSEKVEIRSEDDLLGISMNQMVESFKDVVEQANNIAKGDYSITVVPRSDKDTLNVALFEMTKTLAKNSIESQNQDWLKSGINKLDTGLGGQPNVESLAKTIISFSSRYLNAQLGLFYVIDETDQSYHLKGSFANNRDADLFNEKFTLGQGFIGQVASDKQILIVNREKITNEKLDLGFEKIKPYQLVICPLVHEDVTLGVIQYATLVPFDELKMRFIEMSSSNIAIAIKTILASEKVKLLLQQTSEQAQELAAQQEELRQANEELQEQTTALRVSEEHLQTQQEELKVTNEELEERTKALEIQRDAIAWQNEQLEKAQKEIEQKAKDLEQASRYKSEFLANMSHELRTPLNSILVLSQLLAENKRQHLDNKELEYSKTINNSGKDLLDLINDILDLSKVEAGRIDVYLENMYFNDLVGFVQKSFEPIAKNKGLKLIFDLEKNIPDHIFTDIQRVYQIIKNLYSNALKFTSTGTITLRIYRPDANEIKIDNGLKEKKVIALSVRDTGIGIAKEKFQLIFEAFRQADGTTSRKYGGTGLGLNISKSFVQLLGGEIQVESEEGKGSAFTLYLPETMDSSTIEKVGDETVNEVKAIENGDSSQPEEKEVNKLPEINPVSEEANDDRNSLEEKDHLVLVVDDDKAFTAVLYDLAHEHKFKCLIAYEGETGLKLADTYLPDAIILDIGLPGIDGYEVMKRLKENKRTRGIPVHYISGADKTESANRFPGLGYLKKPVSKENLDEVFGQFNQLVSNPIKHLIVVEDDETMQKSISNLMAGDKTVIENVSSAEEALEKLKVNKFDCMILDLGLKKMDGFEFLEKIKKQEDLASLPVVIYTARNLTEDETVKLKRYTNSIILKGARSFERLLSETTLFLNKVGERFLKDNESQMAVPAEDVLVGKTILIVDDDMRNVFALTNALENYDMKTLFAKNGRDGIEKVENNPDIDLILMDIMMPEMDGYEAMRIIRKNEKFQKLPIIALTAKAMKDDREKCIEAGANEYLSKPVDMAKLISLLRVWLYK